MEDIKIEKRKGKIVKKSQIYKKKIEFHKKMAKLPFEEKIKILVKLQEIASKIRKNKIIWKI